MIKSKLKSLLKHYIFPSKLLKLSKKLFNDKVGLEIGGISNASFSEIGFMPIYPFVKNIDNCTFSNNTIWEGILEQGFNYSYYKNKEKGYQYILEGSILDSIPSDNYDFLLASHSLEHIANPIKSLKEWLRVVKPNGYIVLVLPNKKVTFDHRRPTTEFSHLLDDFKNDTTEEDLTHLDEILELHDLTRDPPAGDFNSFKLRSQNNISNRCLHHHVFDVTLIQEIINYLNLKLVIVEESTSLDILAIAQKST